MANNTMTELLGILSEREAAKLLPIVVIVSALVGFVVGIFQIVSSPASGNIILFLASVFGMSIGALIELGLGAVLLFRDEGGLMKTLSKISFALIGLVAFFGGLFNLLAVLGGSLVSLIELAFSIVIFYLVIKSYKTYL